MPLLSIISGAYNIADGKLSRKSIESILTQSYTDFEFIICNDGSSDSTDWLLREYGNRDPRIKIITNDKNMGLAHSLNRCLEIASGKYIARHDLDDISASERLEKQVSYLEENEKTDILGTAVALFDENGVFDEEYFPLEVRREDFLYTSPYKHGSVIFRREALVNAGGYRVAKETYRTEDYDLFMRLYATGCRGANLKEVLYFFKEDRNARKRRKYRYRIDEAKVRLKGFRALGLMPRGIPYVIKPLIVGLLPSVLVTEVQKKRRKRNKNKL